MHAQELYTLRVTCEGRGGRERLDARIPTAVVSVLSRLSSTAVAAPTYPPALRSSYSIEARTFSRAGGLRGVDAMTSICLKTPGRIPWQSISKMERPGSLV